jgi:hypothetical protein
MLFRFIVFISSKKIYFYISGDESNAILRKSSCKTKGERCIC